MPSISPLSHNRQYRTVIDTFKNLLLNETDNDKTDLLSLLHQLNIPTDYTNQNSRSSLINENNSYVPIELDNLSALYAYYQIDPQMYPPPDLQLYKTIQPSFYLSHSYFQPSRLQNSNRSERKNQKRLRSNKSRKKNNNKRVETDHFHYRNMITVRRLSCQDMLNPQIMMEKSFEYKQDNLKNEWNKKIRSANVVENKLQTYKTLSTGFKSLPPLVQLHTSPIQSIMSHSLDSSSTTKSHTKVLTSPISDTLFQEQNVEKKMLDSMSMTELKVNSLHDSLASSLTSTQLLAAADNRTKPDVTLINSTTPGSPVDFESLADHSPHLSASTSSMIPHFSSAIAPHVPRHISSSTMPMPNVPKTKSIVLSTSTNENIQDLVDQLKTCIAMLRLVLQNKIEDENHTIPNVKSYPHEKRSRRNKKQSQPSSSLSLTSPPDRFGFSKKSISNENNLTFDDITVRRCNASNDQQRKKYQNNIPTSYNDQHEDLKRCLLIYCRDRVNKDQDRNINRDERQRNSHCTWNHSASNEHSSLSQFSQSLSVNGIDVLSVSKSTLILAEEDDEYESLNQLLRLSSL